MEEYRLYIQNKYDEYLMKTENRGMSYGELAYIQNLSEEELKELEEEIVPQTGSGRDQGCGKNPVAAFEKGGGTCPPWNSDLSNGYKPYSGRIG